MTGIAIALFCRTLALVACLDSETVGIGNDFPGLLGQTTEFRWVYDAYQ